MESVAACPDDALELLWKTYELFGMAGEAMRGLPENLGAAANVYDALLENRDRLDLMLEIKKNLIDTAWRAGWAARDRALAQEGRRPALHAV